VSKGDPHGAAGAAVEGKYLSDFFFGTRTLAASEADRLNTDPYLLKVPDNRTQSPYDYYRGGFNTITGGRSGVAGTTVGISIDSAAECRSRVTETRRRGDGEVSTPCPRVSVARCSVDYCSSSPGMRPVTGFL
jgi:hypothetical protein